MRASAAKRPRVFYGWWIILGGMFGLVVQNGFNFHGINAFVLPLSSSFGVSLSVVAATLSLARIETAFIGPLEGYLVDRFGPRTMMLIGVPVLGAGFLLVSFAPNYPIFVAIFLLGVVLGASLGLVSPITTAVASWWVRKRGRAFGILWLGQSAGATVVPAVNWMIENLGWRGAFRAMGVIVLLVGFPVASVMRHRPEQYGMLPDGDEPDPAPIQGSGHAADGADRQSKRVAEPRDFTPREALRTRTFWFFTLSLSVRTSMTSAVAINSFALVDALGGTASQASLLFLLQGIFSAPGRLFLSWAGDALNKRYIMATCLAVMAVSVALMSQVVSMTQLVLLWVPFTVAWGGLTSVPQALRADLFGRRNYASIQGIMAPIQVPFSLTAPIFAAWMFERTGSYEIPFVVFGGMALVSMVLILFAKPITVPAAVTAPARP